MPTATSLARSARVAAEIARLKAAIETHRLSHDHSTFERALIRARAPSFDLAAFSVEVLLAQGAPDGVFSFASRLANLEATIRDDRKAMRWLEKRWKDLQWKEEEMLALERETQERVERVKRERRERRVVWISMGPGGSAWPAGGAVEGAGGDA